MGVDQLGLQVKFERSGNFNIFSSKFDKELLAFLGELTGKQRIKYGVNILADTINHEDLTSADGQFDLLLPMLGSKLDIDHAFRLLSFDPLDALELGVDKQGVSTARHDDGSVLN